MISIEGKMIGYALIWLSKEFAIMKKKQKENVARFARMLVFYDTICCLAKVTI